MRTVIRIYHTDATGSTQLLAASADQQLVGIVLAKMLEASKCLELVLPEHPQVQLSRKTLKVLRGGQEVLT